MTAAAIRRGDIWWVGLDPTQGSEIRKTRPCLVITYDVLNDLRRTVVVIPISSSAEPHPPITVAVTCQGKPGVAIVDQIRAVAKHRFRSRIKRATETDIIAVTNALSQILCLDSSQ